jgi:hypothetical protein
MKYKKRTKMTIVHNLDEIPSFASEDEEREWWDTHELSDQLYDSLPQTTLPGGGIVYTLKKTGAPRRTKSA